MRNHHVQRDGTLASLPIDCAVFHATQGWPVTDPPWFAGWNRIAPSVPLRKIETVGHLLAHGIKAGLACSVAGLLVTTEPGIGLRPTPILGSVSSPVFHTGRGWILTEEVSSISSLSACLLACP